MSDRFMKGAMILSLSMFLTRLLGVLFLIPFQQLVGLGGFALYGYAYLPYSLLVTLSTLGIPIGLAKFIAKYNADGEYDTSRKIFRVGMLIMVLVGMIGFLVMWVGAPSLANWALAGSDDLYNSLDDVILAIRMVSFAVIIIPPMSIFRGFFQGNQDMFPTAISQLVEQLVRVVLIVVASFIVVRVLGGTSQTAVNISVFAAFVAGVSSFVVLYRYWKQKKPKFDALLPMTKPHPKRSTKALLKELLSYALPFAILSSSPAWFQMIDMATFNAGMLRADANIDGYLVEYLFGITITALLKIIMIAVSFSIAFSQPLIPEITEKIRIRDFKSVHLTLTKAIMLTSFITVPAVIGMSLLSNPIFILLFNTGDPEINVLGGAIFGTGAFIALVMGLNGILSATIQAINRQFKALFFLFGAGVIKLVGNLVLIARFGAHGAVYSTVLAYTFFLVMNYLEIRKTTGIETRIILKRHVSIFLLAGAMSLVVWATTYVLNLFIDYTASSFHAAVYVAIAGIIGALVYAGLAIYFDLAKSLFGERLSYERVRARFRRRKA